jgi:hypothetical protein
MGGFIFGSTTESLILWKQRIKSGMSGSERCRKKWKELSPEERKKNRLIESVQVLDAFFTWAEYSFTNQDSFIYTYLPVTV